MAKAIKMSIEEAGKKKQSAPSDRSVFPYQRQTGHGDGISPHPRRTPAGFAVSVQRHSGSAGHMTPKSVFAKAKQPPTYALSTPVTIRTDGTSAKNAFVLSDSSPEESISESSMSSCGILPPLCTADDFANEIQTLAFSQSTALANTVVIDGASLTQTDKEKRKIDTMAYHQMTGGPTEAPHVPRKTFVSAAFDMLRMKPDMTARDGFEAFKVLYTYPHTSKE